VIELVWSGFKILRSSKLKKSVWILNSFILIIIKYKYYILVIIIEKWGKNSIQRHTMIKEIKGPNSFYKPKYYKEYKLQSNNPCSYILVKQSHTTHSLKAQSNNPAT
jgi:hypothetical protein